MKMAQFTDYVGDQYVFIRDGKEYNITSSMLNSLFRAYGYCVDPAVKYGTSLSPQSLEQLRVLALNNNDHGLLSTIRSLASSKAPRMISNGIAHETIVNEKHRYDHLSSENKLHILEILRVILEVGLHLAGWNGGTEPYITSMRPGYDVIRMELKVNPLIQSLYGNPHYPLVKNFSIMKYHRGDSMSLRPSIVDKSLNVDRCLTNISMGLIDNRETMASYLVSTAYYYITTVCNTPLPMVEPLIFSLTQVRTEA